MGGWLMWVTLAVLALPLGLWLGSRVARGATTPPPSKPVPPSKPKRSLDIELVRRRSRELEIELGVGPYAPQLPVEVTEVEVAAGCGHPVTVHAVDGVPPTVPALCPGCWLSQAPARPATADVKRYVDTLWERDRQSRRLVSVPESLRGARCEVYGRLLPVHQSHRAWCDSCVVGVRFR